MRSTYTTPPSAQRPMADASPHVVVQPSATVQRSKPTRRLSSTQLLDGANEIEIEHRGAMYRLRLTSLDKLILTK